jgi:hypothetical protein
MVSFPAAHPADGRGHGRAGHPFSDVGAVVHFLRKVPWTVADFTVDGYRERLARLHDRIQSGGPFVCHSQRFLIEARTPR